MTTTTLSPERRKAIDYLTDRAEAMPAAHVIARFRAAVGEFEAAVDGLDESAARTAFVPGEWTAAQVVDHLAQTTARNVDELRHLVEGRRPPAPPVYEALVSGAAHRVPWEELKAGLAEIPGVTIHTPLPADCSAALVTFGVAGWMGEALRLALRERWGIIIKPLPHGREGLRASLPFFLLEEEIDLLGVRLFQERQ